jgi:DNA-binding NarL/FixJ family response regulator
MVDDHSAMRRAVRAFLKAFEDIQLRNDAASQLSAQAMPEVVLIDEAEFNRRIAENEASRRRSKHIRELFDETAG